MAAAGLIRPDSIGGARPVLQNPASTPDMTEDDLRQVFIAADEAEKDVNAPPGLELADVVWPLVSARVAEVDIELRRAVVNGVIEEDRRRAILNRLVYNLYTLVFGATSRALVVEMAAAESTGLMQGDTPEERYDFFTEMLGDPSFCLQVLDQYPVLKVQLASICQNWKSATCELVARLVADRALIEDAFFRSPPAGKVVDFEVSAGDVHRRGRSTCIVRFACGSRLVYKPRPLTVDRHFRAFAEWINQSLGKTQILVPHTLDRLDYGWSAFITHDPVENERELAAYYERLGSVLALAYLTGLSDLHAENVIAHGAWPVLVDLETLFRPAIKNEDTPGAKRESNRILDQSVLSTQLLAARASNDEDERMVDMGGVVDLADQKTVFKVPIWRDIGRVDARLDHVLHPLEPSQNVPVFKGRRVAADFYGDEIIGGFVETYRLFQANKSELGRPDSPLSAFRDDCTRIVLRPTSLYARLVAASFHPDFLQGRDEKNDFFRTYLVGEDSQMPGHENLVAAEIDDLWQCDIPYFTARAGHREIVSSRGEMLGMLPNTPGLNLAFSRLKRLDDADLARQCWLVNVMLARSDNRAEPDGLPVAVMTGDFDLQAAARAIVHTAAESICARAIFDADNQRATWLTVGEAGHVATVADASLDLYSGLPGIALFLCFAGRLLEKPLYSEIARCALAEITTRIEDPNMARSEVGGFVGTGGLAYALEQMAADFPDLDLGRRAADLLLAVDHAAADALEVAYGLAGALMSCLTIAGQFRSGPAGDCATADLLSDRASMIGRLIADRIAENGLFDQVSDSYAHGRAGIAAALARLFAATGDGHIGTLARRLLNETADVVLSGQFDGSWCRGQSGLILALAEGVDFLDKRKILTRALRQLGERAMPKDHSLCHGAMSIVTTLQAARRHFAPADGPDHPATLRLIRDMTERGLFCGTINSVVSPGLMDGLAGIGFGALSIIRPDAVPAILSLGGIPESGMRV